MGQVIYNGQVGTICGIPVIASKALTTEAFVMTKDAIKLFMKNDVEVEQDRDIEAKKNTIALTTYYVVALVDNQNTLKRFFVDEKNHCIRLHPENKTMEDIIVPECVIQGVAVKVIKSLE